MGPDPTWSDSLRRRLRSKRRCWRWRLLGLALRNVDLPEQFPIPFVHRMNVRIARNNRSVVRPINLPLCQLRSNGIRQCVKAKADKRIAIAFFLPQNVVVWLVLPFASAAQSRFKMRSQKLHGVELIALTTRAHPDQMQVIGHQAISRADQVFTCGGVEHEFAEFSMNNRCQPSSRALLQSVRPKHNRVALVSMPLQSRELALLRRRHDAGMQLSSSDVKRLRSCQDNGTEVATDVRRWKSSAANPPPYVGGYHAT